MRWRRIGRRIAIGLALLAVGVTSCSYGLNAALDPHERPATAFVSGPFVRADGVLTRYETWGRSGTPIVLVHGFAESTFAWHPVARLLARDHRVLALDLRGWGYSERRGPYTLEGWTHQLLAFMRAEGVQRAVLVGHSLGAAVVAQAARERPSAVAGIVLADGDGRKGGAGPPSWLRALVPDTFIISAKRVVLASDTLVRQILDRAYGVPNPPDTSADLRPWTQPFRVQGTESALLDMSKRGVAGLTDAELATVRVPALLLWGRHDGNVPLSAARAAQRDLHGAPLVVLPNAGHLSMLADPTGFAAAVERFARGRE
jgi:pimeloyl-ACP methyl ester carboxylesterase